MARVFMKGCEAIAEAAVRSGCRFFAGYPITPQNEIPEYFARRMPEVGGVFVQGESEVASVNMVYGAAQSGTRSMTSSSSCGISLKSEGISFCASARIPMEYCNVQRGGPAFGAIQPAQQDYLQATRASGNGGFRMMVFAPATVQEAVDMTYAAFDYAQRDRNPVLILADGVLGTIMEPVELPDLKGREEILKVHAKKIKVAEDVDFNKIARMASGASGAELANIVNEAALRAVRDGRRFATQADLEESIEVVIAGYQKKNAIMTDEEKKIVSYHEIGHALVAAMQTHSAPVQKITIVPRTSGALGYTMQIEEGNHYLMSKTEMENKIATLTGGRAAEEVVFHSVTTGASNDIEQATKLARAMITRYGMSDDFDMVALETVNNQYLGGDASLACSAETQTKIDQRGVELVKKQHEKAVNILTENRAKLDELAQYLYEKETITGEEFMHILNAQ